MVKLSPLTNFLSTKSWDDLFKRGKVEEWEEQGSLLPTYCKVCNNRIGYESRTTTLKKGGHYVTHHPELVAMWVLAE